MKRSWWGDFAFPLVAGVCGTAGKCLIVRNPLLGCAFNAPSDSDGDLPSVYSAFLERLLGILTGLPQACWIVIMLMPPFLQEICHWECFPT